MFNRPIWSGKVKHLGGRARLEQFRLARSIEPGREAQRDSHMRSELAHLLETPEFRRSPVLSRLLAFLVVETLAGRGASLKGYSVAVDGLGRPGDFDAQSDSYPRVQIGRLRKALTAHYAAHDPAGEFALVIEPGSYRVRLSRPLSARGSRPIVAPAASRANDTSAARNNSLEQVVSHRPRALWFVLAFAISLLVVALLIWWRSTGSPDRAANLTVSSPVVLVKTVEGANQRDAVAEMAYGILIDGLSRSWVAQLRTEAADRAISPASFSGDAFVLSSQLVATGPQAQRLFLRLTDPRSGILIWSSAVMLPSQPDEMNIALAPLIARLGGSFGVIATNEVARHAQDQGPGYLCMLRYTQYEKTRDPSLRAGLDTCLRRPVAEQRLKPPILMARSFLALVPQAKGGDQAKAVRQAFGFANQAVKADANDSLAQFAQARLSFVTGDCVAGKRHTDLAVNANPYDPVLVAVLAGLMYQCGYPEAAPLIERAFLIRQSGSDYGRLPLILAMIAQGRTDRLALLAENAERQQGRDISYFFLCETLIDAATGKPVAAKANWQRFLRSNTARAAPVDSALRVLIASPALRQQVIEFLTAKGIILSPFKTPNS